MTLLTEKPRGAAVIRVLIVADTRFYLDGLAEILKREHDFEIVGTAGDLATALDHSPRVSPNVVLLDMAVPGSSTAVASLLSLNKNVKVVALGISEIEREVITLAEAGVSGYVSRSATLDDLIHAVRSTVRGELVVPPKIAAGLFRRVRALAARSNLDDATRLTPREMEVAELIDRGLSNKEISGRLCIQISTVKNHVHNLLEKMHVNRRGEAAARLRHRLARIPARQSDVTSPQESDPPRM